MEPEANLSLPTALRHAAQQYAQLCAIRGERESLDYAALDRLSDHLASYLASHGIAPGDRVGLYCGNDLAFPITYFAILKAGAIVVPINVLLSTEEIGYIYRDAEIRGLIYQGPFEPTVRVLREQLRLRCCLQVGEGELPIGVTSWADALEVIDRSTRPALDAGAERAAVIIYTSGTTGRPKGAVLSHRNLLSNAYGAWQALRLREAGETIVVVLPMFHAFAGTVGLIVPLLHGCTIVALPRFDLRALADAIEATKATVFLGVPTLYIRLLDLPESDWPKLRSLRVCVSGGAALPLEVMQRFEQRYAKPIYEGDGPTECGPVTCVNPVGGIRKPGSVGLPIPGVEMTVMDEQGGMLPDGETGEICVRSPSVMLGYWRQPEATRAAFHGDWFRTGDLGYRDVDGYFYLVDRLKDLIIYNGVNIYPRAIEEVLYRHPAVREAAVVSEPDSVHGEVPVAYVALQAGMTVSDEEMLAGCRAALGRHEVPRKIYVLPDLPKTATGKILKRALRRQGEVERGIDRGGDVARR